MYSSNNHKISEATWNMERHGDT